MSSPTKTESSHGSLSPPALGFGSICRCAVLSCCFNLQFLCGTQRWPSTHTRSCHLYILHELLFRSVAISNLGSLFSYCWAGSSYSEYVLQSETCLLWLYSLFKYRLVLSKRAFWEGGNVLPPDEVAHSSEHLEYKHRPLVFLSLLSWHWLNRDFVSSSVYNLPLQSIIKSWDSIPKQTANPCTSLPSLLLHLWTTTILCMESSGSFEAGSLILSLSPILNYVLARYFY